MDQTLQELEGDPNTKVVVIAGEGGNFSAGQDLKEFFRDLEDKPAEAKRIQALATVGAGIGSLCMTSRPSPWSMAIVPVAPSCSSSPSTLWWQLRMRSSLSEVNWGILPGALVAKAMTEAVLYRHALYYACLGEPFDGKEAVRIGLANMAVPKAKLEAETEKLAEKLKAKSPAVLKATKQAIRAVRTMDVPGLRLPGR